MPEAQALCLDTGRDSGFTEFVNFILFGYPRTGKTTLFNLLTGAGPRSDACEDGKKEPNVRTRALPDARLDAIAALYPEKKKVAAVARLHRPRRHLLRRGQGRRVLSTASARPTASSTSSADSATLPVPHPKGKDRPRRTTSGSWRRSSSWPTSPSVDARLEKLDKDLKKMKDPEGEKERDLLDPAHGLPRRREGRSATFPFSAAEEKLVRSFAFLSQKPLLHMINVDETDAASLEAPASLRPGRQRPDPRLLRPDRERDPGARRRRERTLSWPNTASESPAAARFFRAVPGFLDVLTFFTDRQGRGQGLAAPGGRLRPDSRRRHPFRHRKGLHPGRGHPLGRAPPARLAPEGQGQGSHPARRARTTSSGTGTSSISGSPNDQIVHGHGPRPRHPRPGRASSKPPTAPSRRRPSARGQPGLGQGPDPRRPRGARRPDHPRQRLPPLPPAGGGRHRRARAASTPSSPGRSPSSPTAAASRSTACRPWPRSSRTGSGSPPTSTGRRSF